MEPNAYQELIKSKKPNEPKQKNSLIAFLVGGSLGISCEAISHLLIVFLNISKSISYTIICLFMILISSFLTALGFFDNLVVKGKCGLITGLGANFFNLAGSVILYGIISSFFLCILKVIFNG